MVAEMASGPRSAIVVTGSSRASSRPPTRLMATKARSPVVDVSSRASAPRPLGGWKTSPVTSGMVTSTSSTRRYCTTVTTPVVGPELARHGHHAGGATGDEGEHAGRRRDVATEGQHPAGGDAQQDGAQHDQEDRRAVGHHSAQGGHVDQGAHRDADQPLGHPERPGRQGERRPRGQRVRHPTEHGSEEHGRRHGQHGEGRAGDEADRDDDGRRLQSRALATGHR